MHRDDDDSVSEQSRRNLSNASVSLTFLICQYGPIEKVKVKVKVKICQYGISTAALSAAANPPLLAAPVLVVPSVSASPLLRLFSTARFESLRQSEQPASTPIATIRHV